MTGPIDISTPLVSGSKTMSDIRWKYTDPKFYIFLFYFVLNASFCSPKWSDSKHVIVINVYELNYGE